MVGRRPRRRKPLTTTDANARSSPERLGTALRGTDARTGSSVSVALARESQRDRNRRAQTALPMLLAVAADPDLHRLATWIDERSSRDLSVGGRPRSHPSWCLLVFGAAISVFGSASATARHLHDSVVWQAVLASAARAVGPGELDRVPDHGPSRDQWNYFMRVRLGPDALPELSCTMRDLAAHLARDVGLLDPDRASLARLSRTNVVGVDGKVFSSPQRHELTERVDTTTGEIRTVRRDPARQLHGEGGQDGMAWGSKYAIASVRSPMSGHRVILGIEHVPHRGAGGEGGVFTSLLRDVATRQPGIAGFVADGALRGTHIAEIQRQTGSPVISPPRRRDKKHGGIVLDGYGYAAAPLPPSRTRTTWLSTCGGHALYAAGGRLVESVITADGTIAFAPVRRRQTKRQKLSDGTFAFYARHTLSCHATGIVHDWWEPLTPTKTDALHDFNRSDYLRVRPPDDPDYGRVYGMRADTESLNSQLERAFHNRRLPAWGQHNQTVIVLMAALAQNAWARHTWQNAVDRATAPPGRAA